MSDERTTPHDLAAEAAVLGALLVSSDLLATVAPILEPSYFFRAANRTIFETMRRLWAASESIDFITVVSALRQAGKLESCGGPAYVSGLVDGMPRTAHVESYATIVRAMAHRRELIQIANDAIDGAYDLQGGEFTEVVGNAGMRLCGLSTTRKTAGLVKVSEFLSGAVAAIEQSANRRGQPWGLTTGYVDLDELISGLCPQQLVLLAGRTGKGKSSLGMNIAANVAEAGHTVAYFSLEMSSTDLVLRHLAGRGRIDLHRIRHGYLRDDDFARLAEAVGHAHDLPFYLDDSAGIGLFDIRARCQALQIQRGLKLIVVDYLQLMGGNKNAENRQRQVAEISTGLKNLAKDLDVPILAMSQLSRKPDGRKDSRPQLSDLRESGQLENDADVVMFIHREEEDPEKPENDGIAELIIGKQRNGPIGSIKLAWLAQYTRFESLRLTA